MAAMEGKSLVAQWSEEVYDARKPEIVEEVNSKFCCVTEWVEQPMPYREGDIREVLRRSGPFLSEEVVEALPAEGVAEGGPLEVLVFGDSSGVMSDVLEVLKSEKKLGSRCKTVDLAAQRENLSLEMMCGYLASGPYDVVVFASALDMPASGDAEDVKAWSETLVTAYLFLGQALLKEPIKKVVAVTADAFTHSTATHEKAGLGVCCGGFVFGATNTMRMENKDAKWHYVDVDHQVDGAIIRGLAHEIARNTGFGENSVKLTADCRYVARQVLAEPKYSTNYKFKTPQKGVIAIGGGNGALGLVMGKYFLDHLVSKKAADTENTDKGEGSLSIKFLSRSTKISGDQNLKAWSEIEALAQEKGVNVEQAKCDVSKREAIAEFCAANNEALVGFVHSAGVLRDGLLVNQTVQNYEDVYKPKAYAALYLHEALAASCPNLEFLWMFSSVAVYGNPGQSNYSGANSFLDTLSRHRKAQGLPSTVIQWAGWGEVGMASQLEGIAKKRMEESPMPLFTNKQGLHGMDVGISTGLPVFCVMRFNAEAFFDIHNKDNKKSADTYSAKFWGSAAPARDLDELDLYEAVVNAYDVPRELQYDHFINDLDDPFDHHLDDLLPKVEQAKQ
eukprot:CAMPEP_0118889336 /NCGR_PEP_ID=MMETSP1166-20130328/314_1 /TAXON_ID=1104430 /ORGANISM="Chrysoreinhardia sp, Strain CCMP3193" /LENGTH=617 /DNA_ID=CAMNT_0006827923 /DNA_START=27 /DNA_END=1880 /DNA_ORIENTATION=-